MEKRIKDLELELVRTQVEYLHLIKEVLDVLQHDDTRGINNLQATLDDFLLESKQELDQQLKERWSFPWKNNSKSG